MPPSHGERTRFIADAMLGSLARKLRALGFDTSYYKSGDDSGLVGLAAREGRIILTSDRILATRSASNQLKAILVTGKNDGERVRAIALAARESGIRLARGDPLCSLCGGELENMRRKQVEGRVPQAVEVRHRLFFRCTSCGQYYWHGSHWKKLRSLASRLG
jgi:uncharacterized protein with PIN domain